MSIKLIYLVGGALTERWNSYYCIDSMTSFFDVEYWDCSEIIDNGYNVTGHLERNYVVTLYTKHQFEQKLKQLPSDVIFVIELGFVEVYYNILKLISKYVKNCIVIDFWTYNLSNSLANSSSVLSDKNSVILMLKNFLYKSDEVWLFAKVLRGAFNRQKLSQIFKCYKKRKSNKRSVCIENKCKNLFNIYELSYKPSSTYAINHPDYEKFLDLRHKQDRTDKYIVFIGDFYPLHPELFREPGIDFSKEVIPYTNSLCRFFKLVEHKYGCRVVIAEHPSGKWITNPFENREIIYYKTAELVRDSYAVCLHCSCAFSYVALFDKPVAFISNSSLELSRIMSNATNDMATLLGLPVINTDTVKEDSISFQFIDRDIRRKYIKTFADTDCNLRNRELFKRYFFKIHEEIVNSKNIKQ